MNTFRLLASGQVIFFVAIALCTALLPHFAETGGGISNYGLYAKTIPFFTAGFVASAGSELWASRSVRSRMLRVNLSVLGVLMLAVLVSTYPYKVNTTLDIIHEATSQLLFVFEIWFGAWLSFRYKPGWLTRLLFTAQCVSAVIGLLTILGLFHLLFISQILTGLAFGTLLVYAGSRTV